MLDAARPYSYTVKSGDTLSRIASRFGLPWPSLYAYNRDEIGPDPGRIFPGQELLIPGRYASAPVEKPYILVTASTRHRWPRGSARLLFIVLHDPVAVTVPGLLRYLSWNSRRVSYDYVIDEGDPPKVYVLSGDDTWVGHAGYGNARDVRTGRWYGREHGNNLNWYSEGLCLFKRRDDEGPFPERMVNAAAHFAADWLTRHREPVQNCLAHREVDPRRRRDPRGLDMDGFRARVADLLG